MSKKEDKLKETQKSEDMKRNTGKTRGCTFCLA